MYNICMKVINKKLYSILLIVLIAFTSIIFTGCSDAESASADGTYLGVKIAYIDNDSNLNNVVKEEIENFSIDVLSRLVGTYGFGVGNNAYNGYNIDFSITPNNIDKFLEIETLYQTNLDAIRGDIYSDSLISDSNNLVLDNNYYRWNFSNFNKDLTKFRLWEYASLSEIEAEKETYLTNYLNCYQKLFVLNIYELLLDKEITTSVSLEKQVNYIYEQNAQEYINNLIYGENGIFNKYTDVYDHIGFNTYEVNLIKQYILDHVIGVNVVNKDNEKENSLTYNKYYFKNYVKTIDVLISGYNQQLNFTDNNTSIKDNKTGQEFIKEVSSGVCSNEYGKFNALSSVKYADISLKSIEYDDSVTGIECYKNFINTFSKRVKIKSIIPITGKQVGFNGIWFNVNIMPASTTDISSLDKEFNVNEKVSDITFSFNYFNGESISKPIIEEDNISYIKYTRDLINDKEKDSANENLILIKDEISLEKFTNVCEALSSTDGGEEKLQPKYNCINLDSTNNKYVRNNDCFYNYNDIENSQQTETIFNSKKAESAYIEFTINLSYDLPIEFGFVCFN